MIAKLLCALGLHFVVVTKQGVDIDKSDYQIVSSAIGYCAWCNKPYYWDH